MAINTEWVFAFKNTRYRVLTWTKKRARSHFLESWTSFSLTQCYKNAALMRETLQKMWDSMIKHVQLACVYMSQGQTFLLLLYCYYFCLSCMSGAFYTVKLKAVFKNLKALFFCPFHHSTSRAFKCTNPWGTITAKTMSMCVCLCVLKVNNIV